MVHSGVHGVRGGESSKFRTRQLDSGVESLALTVRLCQRRTASAQGKGNAPPDQRSPDEQNLLSPGSPTGAPRRALSLNHLVRPRQHRWRDGEAERLRGLEVDDQGDLGRTLDRKASGVRSLQHLVH
jgi:hypothetical protein